MMCCELTLEVVCCRSARRTEVVMWPCDQCDAQFNRQAKLERHKLTHSVVPPPPRIIVITPSGLRLTAQQVNVSETALGIASVAAAASDSAADNGIVYVSSVADS